MLLVQQLVVRMEMTTTGMKNDDYQSATAH